MEVGIDELRNFSEPRNLSRDGIEETEGEMRCCGPGILKWTPAEHNEHRLVTELGEWVEEGVE
jgi:hypothetical protein